MNKLTIDGIRKAVNDKLSANPVIALSAIRIVSLVMSATEELCPQCTPSERRAMAILALERVVAGGDGVLGTDDDLISLQVLQHLRTLLGTSMMGDLVAALEGVTMEAKAKCSCWPVRK